eukprot:8921147-Lingulodinium_polyedra.AAC.1
MRRHRKPRHRHGGHVGQISVGMGLRGRRIGGMSLPGVCIAAFAKIDRALLFTQDRSDEAVASMLMRFGLG